VYKISLFVKKLKFPEIKQR